MIEKDSPSVCARIYFLRNILVERRSADGTWEEASAKDWGNTHDARTFLAYLFCHERLAERADLLAALWPHLDNTEHRFGTLVSQVRKILGRAHLLEYIRDCFTFRLADQSSVWIDVVYCFDLLREAKKVGHATPQGLEILQEAEKCFGRGKLLEGIEGIWRHSIGQEVYTKRKRCLHLLGEAYMAQGNYEHAEEIAEKLLREKSEGDPEDEKALCLLMVALDEQGETSEALRRYEEAKQRYPDLSLVADNLAKSLRETSRINNGTNLWLPPSAQVADAQDGQDVNKNRRELLQDTASIVGALTMTGIDPLSVVSPEEFLAQSRSSIKACWNLISGKGLTIAEEVLTTYTPPLMRLAFGDSLYRTLAAGIATQAKILQAILAMHRLDYTKRELCCYEAVKCGSISGDNRLHSAALMYLAYTYIHCLPQQPKRAADLFQQALNCLGKSVSILRSDIYIGLADAYALCGEEEKAIDAIAKGKDNFPANPELDPSYLYADLDEAEVYQWEGRMYNDLALLFQDKSVIYYKNADNAFEMSTKLRSIAERSSSETIIHRAITACGLNDLELYASCLETGGKCAMSLGSKKWFTGALETFQRTPSKWKNERAIQNLAMTIFAEQGRLN